METIGKIANEIVNTILQRAIHQGVSYQDIYYMIYGHITDDQDISDIMDDERLTHETKKKLLNIR